jgi:hypothetical protein
MPWSIVTLAALVVLHVIIDDWPVVIDAGEALSAVVGSGCGATLAG